MESRRLDEEINQLENKIELMTKEFKKKIHDFDKYNKQGKVTMLHETIRQALPKLSFSSFRILKAPTETVSKFDLKNADNNEQSTPIAFTNLFWAGGDNAFSNQLVATTNKGHALVYNTATCQCLNRFEVKGVLNTCAIETVDNGLIAVGGFDGGIYVYNINTPKERKDEDNNQKKFTGHQGVVSSVRFLSSSFMISGSYDSVLMLWDINSQGKFVSAYHDHNSEISGLDVSDINGNIFATGSGDTTVKLWDIRQKKACVTTFKGSDSSINCVKFVPGRLSTLASGSEDSKIRLWDLRAWKELGEYKKTDTFNSINSIGFSKSGQMLFASYSDSYTISFWNLFGGEEPFTDHKHLGNMNNSKGIVQTSINAKGDIIGYVLDDQIILIK